MWRGEHLMNNLVVQPRLAEKAAEDIYFAKLDRGRIAVLHETTHEDDRAFRPSGPAQKRETAKARVS
jgi:hypothetical protein